MIAADRLADELERSAAIGRGPAQFRGLALECVALGLVLDAAARMLSESGRAEYATVARAAEICLARHVPHGSVTLTLVRPALPRIDEER